MRLLFSSFIHFCLSSSQGHAFSVIGLLPRGCIGIATKMVFLRCRPTTSPNWTLSSLPPLPPPLELCICAYPKGSVSAREPPYWSALGLLWKWGSISLLQIICRTLRLKISYFRCCISTFHSRSPSWSSSKQIVPWYINKTDANPKRNHIINFPHNSASPILPSPLLLRPIDLPVPILRHQLHRLPCHFNQLHRMRIQLLRFKFYLHPLSPRVH